MTLLENSPQTAPHPHPHHPHQQTPHLQTVHTEADDPAATALVAGLLAELTARIGADALAEFDHRRREEFAPWLGGDLLVLAEDGRTVAGGAYRRYDSTTVELDWIWTRPDRRRGGLARRVVAELENAAGWRGYQRAYAVIGPGRTEARGLLMTSGYALLGSAAGPLDYLGFVKTLSR
ncbi:MAG TPA: GNAT family N-acetyltransferase [Actinocrinis sp.]|nr:GNAT family N-acetyltransferase [Actinocrinis sp.]